MLQDPSSLACTCSTAVLVPEHSLEVSCSLEYPVRCGTDCDRTDLLRLHQQPCCLLWRNACYSANGDGPQTDNVLEEVWGDAAGGRVGHGIAWQSGHL